MTLRFAGGVAAQQELIGHEQRTTNFAPRGHPRGLGESQLRLQTIVRLRWVAVLGGTIEDGTYAEILEKVADWMTRDPYTIDADATIIEALHMMKDKNVRQAAVLARQSGTDDIPIGVPVTSRPHPDLDPLIGLFANTIALRCRVAPDATPRRLLAEHVHLLLERAVQLALRKLARTNEHLPETARRTTARCACASRTGTVPRASG